MSKNLKQFQSREKKWFVYLIETVECSYYTGITTDPFKRFLQHQQGKGAKYLRSKEINGLRIIDSDLTKSMASKIEYQTKQLSSLKKKGLFYQ